jgi:redox-sensitive bicupin YhaK (pirin superfamily)
MATPYIHRSGERGHVNFGWLDSYHSFSFGQWYDPRYTNFGVLRVLNDDTVAPGAGFGRHPHANFEIISIPLAGALEHRDSMGNKQIIKEGEIQVMSAGTGVEHSEMNASREEEVKFLQIWLFPNKKNVTPRYDQKLMNPKGVKNAFVQILSPQAQEEGVWVHQDAWFHIGHFTESAPITYTLKKEGNGLFIYVLEGNVDVEGVLLGRRDALGLDKQQTFTFLPSENSQLLLMEVPMQLPSNY